MVEQIHIADEITQRMKIQMPLQADSGSKGTSKEKQVALY